MYLTIANTRDDLAVTDALAKAVTRFQVLGDTLTDFLAQGTMVEMLLTGDNSQTFDPDTDEGQQDLRDLYATSLAIIRKIEDQASRVYRRLDDMNDAISQMVGLTTDIFADVQEQVRQSGVKVHDFDTMTSDALAAYASQRAEAALANLPTAMVEVVEVNRAADGLSPTTTIHQA
jgi:hypothetical protein